jgi:predicted acetyltransferase
MIKFTRTASILPVLRGTLDRYTDKEFGHIPFVQQRSWASPDWTVVLEEDGELATFCNVVVRTVSFDGQLYKAAGINNVITSKQHRGKGYSSSVLRETQAYLFDTLHADCGLLLCAAALLPFYSRLGWYTVNSILYYEQPQGSELYDSNIMLLTKPDAPRTFPELIDLNGLP